MQHVVMLFHGLASSSLEVARLGKFLAKNGFATYEPNIAGFCYGAPCTTWRDWVDAMRGEFRRLSAMYQTVSIVGVSMGATLALAVAQEEEDIAALVLLSTAIAYDGWAIPWYRPFLSIARHLPWAKNYKYREREPFGVKNAEMRARIKKAVLSAETSEAGGAYIGFDHVNQADAMIAHVRRRVDLVTCPTLVMHATEDETVSPRNAEWLMNHISAKRKKLVFLGQSYHMITIDNEYELVFHETQLFIKTAVNARASTMVFEQPEVVSKALQRAMRAEVA
jgi:carboxylesterase